MTGRWGTGGRNWPGPRHYVRLPGVPPGAAAVHPPADGLPGGRACLADFIRSRSRFSSSALLLAAVNVVLSQYTGHPEVTMSMVVGNRPASDRREMVGTLSSAGLFHLDLTGLTFSQVVRRTFGASGKGHQFGFCDPDAIAVLRDEMSLAHGGHVDLGFFVNDVQSDVQVTEDLPALTEDGLRELASKTEFIDEHGMSTKPVMVDMQGVVRGPQPVPTGEAEADNVLRHRLRAAGRHAGDAAGHRAAADRCVSP